MHVTRLSESELTNILASLNQWRVERGAEILGSRLGTFVLQATGRTVRELGGVRSLAEHELSGALSLSQEQTHTPDVSFTLRGGDIDHSSKPPGDLTQKELWRHFSNPRLDSAIAVNEVGDIVIALPTSLPMTGFTQVKRPTSEDYREVAKTFAAQQNWQDDENIAAIFDKADFYNDWIQWLRGVSATDNKALHQWEAARAEYVEKRLNEELLKCGMSEARALEVVAKAKSREVNRVPRASTKTAISTTVSSQDITTDFRTVVHFAIDLMTIDELRRLPISAGVLYDATRKRIG